MHILQYLLQSIYVPSSYLKMLTTISHPAAIKLVKSVVKINILGNVILLFFLQTNRYDFV